jgi:hypothetical protein
MLVVNCCYLKTSTCKCFPRFSCTKCSAADSEQLLFAEASVGVRLVATCLASARRRLCSTPLSVPLFATSSPIRTATRSTSPASAPADSLAANRARLVALAQRAFGAIADSLDSCPLDVRMLLASIQSIVEMRFEGGGKSARAVVPLSPPLLSRRRQSQAARSRPRRALARRAPRARSPQQNHAERRARRRLGRRQHQLDARSRRAAQPRQSKGARRLFRRHHARPRRRPHARHRRTSGRARRSRRSTRSPS